MKKYKHSEITPELIYNKRRKFIKSIGLGVGSISLSSIPFLNNAYSQNKTKLTSYEDITTYNNYYEFGTSKSDPYRNSQEFITKPWSVTIEGEVENPVTISAEEIISLFPSEERIYKLRCVEGWSMVIPWMGFSLSKILSKVSIKNTAKFVEFESRYVTYKYSVFADKIPFPLSIFPLVVLGVIKIPVGDGKVQLRFDL